MAVYVKVRKLVFGVLISAIVLIIFAGIIFLVIGGHHTKDVSETTNTMEPAPDNVQKISGLAGRTLYNDRTRQIHTALKKAQDEGNTETAQYLEYLANQPGVTWLNGPTKQDPSGDNDIAMVARTSKEADQLHQIVIYQLYAIPNRDACAEYSKGGFTTERKYLTWVKQLSDALAGDAVFLIEADAIAHAINKDCITEAEARDRYALLKSVITELKSNKRVSAIYLDVGHPEWIVNNSQLVEPLKASGLEMANGIAVNVSNYIELEKVLAWTTELLQKIGPGKTAVIDTSRNGNGAPDSSFTGEDRWCNPKGRAIGELPATSGLPTGIDAYLWVKNAGESDGSCKGYPEAGTFVPELAVDLVKNRR